MDVNIRSHFPKGEEIMNVSYESKEAMTFIGFHTEIAPEEGYRKCPEFWEKEFKAKYARLWRTMKPETPAEEAILANGIGMYAICTDADGRCTYWIAGLYRGGAVPEGLELYTFPKGGWAVFTAKGPIPETLQALNTAVWRDWMPAEGRKRGADGTATLETYSAGDPHSPGYECGIWVPLKGEAGREEQG